MVSVRKTACEEINGDLQVCCTESPTVATTRWPTGSWIARARTTTTIVHQATLALFIAH